MNVAATVILQHDEQSATVSVRPLPSLLRTQGLDPLHLRLGTEPHQPVCEVTLARVVLQHDPVTDGRVDGLLFLVPRLRSVEDAADARHKRLQRRSVRDDPVAQVAPRHDGVPRMRKCDVRDAPDDAEGANEVAKRSDRRHEVGRYGAFDCPPEQVFLWISELNLQNQCNCKRIKLTGV